VTTIRSRIGPVLDPVGIRSDATRRRGTAPVERFAVGGQPVHSSVGVRALVADGHPDATLASAGESTAGRGGLHR